MAGEKERPINRMLTYIGMKMESLELVYGLRAENGKVAWRSEYHEHEWKILDDISKTLSLVASFEGDFKRLLQAKMGKRK